MKFIGLKCYDYYKECEYSIAVPSTSIVRAEELGDNVKVTLKDLDGDNLSEVLVLGDLKGFIEYINYELNKQNTNY